MTNRTSASDHIPDHAPARDPEPACAAALVAAACVAIGLAAIVWTIYGSLDRDAFDVRATVITPVLSALGVQAR